ncbi:ATP-binding protein [Dyadobacter subterraneus]|uniref:histidine kinase n=1 Tax=Dyadobacter subterraneus TaxID=2773304 RepID=A0ABR9W8U1_9BACT|nr:ATP-binding protein [Dyadobacter subterraneus]MBE9461852.1 PAS domain-containing protein [Dyadobacter subterraneus]
MNDFSDAEKILHAMPCGCIIFGDDGIICFVNDTLCQLLDFKSEELIQQKLGIIFTVSSQIFYQTQLYPLIRLKGKADEIFLSLKMKQGTILPVMLHGKTTFWNQKPAYIFIFTTVFERQKHEDELLRAKQEQQLAIQENGVLIGLKTELQLQHQILDQQLSTLKQRNLEYIQLSKVLSHDMQEPIRKIDIFAGILHGHIHEGKGELTLQKIHKSVARLRSLTSSLHQFVELDLTDEGPSQINPGELINEASSRIKTELQFADFNLEMDTLPLFEGRAAQMEILFFELFKNAVQNRSLEELLVIKVRGVLIEENSFKSANDKYRYTEHIRLEISDNGIGFDNAYSAYIFELFNKLHKNSEGSGLGLALCKRVVSSHYGSITARSQEGKGTSIIIILPVLQQV